MLNSPQRLANAGPMAALDTGMSSLDAADDPLAGSPPVPKPATDALSDGTEGGGVVGDGGGDGVTREAAAATTTTTATATATTTTTAAAAAAAAEKEAAGDEGEGEAPGYWFDLDDPSWPTFLETEGYVVVKRVASQDDVATAKSLIWDDLEGAYGVARDEPATWLQSAWRLPIAGLCANLAQSAGPWHLRGRQTPRHRLVAPPTLPSTSHHSTTPLLYHSTTSTNSQLPRWNSQLPMHPRRPSSPPHCSNHNPTDTVIQG